MALTYNYPNFIGSGCYSKVDFGLTRFGMDVISEMNRLGILIDLSHVGEKTTFEAMEASKKPVVFTHSNAKEVFDCPRNITDEQIKACAEKEGVIGLDAWGGNVRAPKNEDDYLTTEDLLVHFDHMVDIVGVDHIGFGLDFSEVERPVWARQMSGEVNYAYIPGIARWSSETYCIKSITEFPNFTRGLVSRGYSDQEITKILGGNFIRVFKEVWKE
jgi:membrane dipeptidase